MCGSFDVRISQRILIADSMDELTVAWLCTVIACIGFGCCYLPVKKVDVQDGRFFTLWLATGIFIVGLAQWLGDGMYKFEPVAMFGGAIWAAGNLCVPFIIKRCGLGIGQLVWGATNMLTGWATGTFGLFGVNRASVANPELNYIGVLLSICSLAIFTQMGEGERTKEKTLDDEEHHFQAACGGGGSESGDARTFRDESTGSDARPSGGFFTGFVVALFTGVLFGSNFNPPTVLQQQGQRDVAAGLAPTHSVKATDYVLSHFAGILLFTIVAFTAFKFSGSACHVGTDVVLPGLGAGILWGVAQVCWFNANSVLSYVVAFPIIVGIPGVIAALIGVVFFGENRGKRNLSLLALVFCVQAVSLICIAASHGGRDHSSGNHAELTHSSGDFPRRFGGHRGSLEPSY